jgi:hypothetical protein
MVNKTYRIPPMTDLQAIFHASLELGKLAKATDEDGKIVSGNDLHMMCALLDTAYAGLWCRINELEAALKMIEKMAPDKICDEKCFLADASIIAGQALKGEE